MSKKLFLKTDVTNQQLEEYGFIPHYKNYYLEVASKDDMVVEIFIDMSTRQINLYVQNDPTFTTNYARVGKDEEIEYVEPDEAYEKSTIDEFVNITAFIDFLQMGWFEVRE